MTGPLNKTTDMLFNSYEFIFIYLPVTLVGFFLVARISYRAAALWLAIASLFFYGWWNPKFVSLLLASIVFNFGAGWVIGRTRASGRGKGPLVVAVSANLLLLALFLIPSALQYSYPIANGL